LSRQTWNACAVLCCSMQVWAASAALAQLPDQHRLI
jgi:hypothetical protein